MWAKNFTTNTKHTWIIKMQSRWQKELSFLIEKINKEVFPLVPCQGYLLFLKLEFKLKNIF